MDNDPLLTRRRAIILISGAAGGLLLAKCASNTSSPDKKPNNTTPAGLATATTSPRAEAPAAERTLAEYVEVFRSYAALVEQRFGIDQNVVLAQSFVESAGGTSELAIKANAFFGIKAKEDWDGTAYPKWTAEEITAEEFDTAKYPDQKLIKHLKNGNVLVSVPELFRQYDTVLESFLDYGDRITNSGYYDKAVAVRDDPIAYIEAVAPTYATDSDYATKVTARYEDILSLS